MTNRKWSMSIFSISFFVFFPFFNPASAQDYNWLTQLNIRAIHSGQWVNPSVVDDDGYIYLIGHHPDKYRRVLVKISSAGNLIWERNLDEDNILIHDSGYLYTTNGSGFTVWNVAGDSLNTFKFPSWVNVVKILMPDPTNIIFVGNGTDDDENLYGIYVSKYSIDGVQQWDNTIREVPRNWVSDYVYDAQLDNNGNIYLAATVTENSLSRIFFAKVLPNGLVDWTRLISNYLGYGSFCIDGDGRSYIGLFDGPDSYISSQFTRIVSYDEDGNLKFTKDFDAPSDGDIPFKMEVINSTLNVVGITGEDVSMINFNLDGVLLNEFYESIERWVPNWDYDFGINAVLSSGTDFIAGMTRVGNSEYKVTLLKINSAGQLEGIGNSATLDYCVVNNMYKIGGQIIIVLTLHDSDGYNVLGLISFPETITSVENEELVNEFLLYQNYPNPFNPNTKIKYSVPASSHIKLKIFDVLGNEIVKLVDELKSPGTYESEFNAEKLSTGVYFYTLYYDNIVITRKMLLLK